MVTTSQQPVQSKTSSKGQPLLDVKNLTKHFPIKRGLLAKTVGHVKAVTDVSFTLNRGETLGLVGESGCGKTTIGRSILRLIEPSSGRVRFDGNEIQDLSHAELRPIRRRMQIIFQDPYSSLNPRMTVEQIIAEGLIVHKIGASADERRALAVNPKFIVCDEAVSALDVSVQAQIINLMIELQDRLHLTIVFVSHDLRVVRHLAHRVAVMYLGRVVELGPTEPLFRHPRHPYTAALIAAAPSLDFEHRNLAEAVRGELPSAHAIPAGCAFHPRCPRAIERCRRELPDARALPDGRVVACHLPLD